MPGRRFATIIGFTLILAGTLVVHVPAQQAPQVSPSLFAEMRWRNIGPYRGGRTKAAAGVPSQPYTFYIGMVNGGVWKTTDAGPHVEADLRRSANRIDRLGVGRAVGSQRRLRRQRRRAAASGSRGRRRHLQVHRRGADLDASGPARRAADSEDRHRSRRIPTGCSWRRSVIPTVPTRSAASFDRPTAARRSNACCSRTRTPAARTSTSIPPTRTSSTRRCGSSGRGRGRTARGAAPTAASSSRPTAARPGSR